MKHTLNRLIVTAFIALFLGACATSPPVVGKRFFWPPEPDEPKIEWITMYLSDLQLKESTWFTEIIGVDATINFERPISAAGDGEGRIVISDQVTGRVTMFDLNNRVANALGGNEAADFRQPSGVAVDADGNFYVADNSLRKVTVVSGKNVVLRVMDFSKHVKSIGGIAIDRARGILLVPDPRGIKVLSFSLTGELRSTLESKGYFSYPNAVTVASDGSMFIADSFNATIVHMTAEGKFIKAIGRRGDSQGSLALVTSVAVDSEDNIYATDGRNHNITIFNKDGEALLVVGGSYSIATGNVARGGFLIPQGISIDKNDRIYVADSLNHRVQVFQYLNKRYLAEHPILPAKQ